MDAMLLTEILRCSYDAQISIVHIKCKVDNAEELIFNSIIAKTEN